MKDDLTGLWQRDRPAESSRRRGWRCPNETRLAAFVDGGLETSTRTAIAAHLVDCRSCIDQVSFLARSQEWSDYNEVPSHLIVKAKRLVEAKSKPGFLIGWRWATAAMAACLVMTFLMILATRARLASGPDNQNLTATAPQNSPASERPQQSPAKKPDLVAIEGLPPEMHPPAVSSRKHQSIPSIRKDKADSNVPELLSPREGAVLSGEPINLKWQTVPDVVFYEVFVKNASGEIVTTTQTESTSFRLASNNLLKAGTRYFVSVQAQLHDGRIVRSTVKSFTLAR